MQLKSWRFIGVSLSLLVLLLLGQAQPASQPETPGRTSLGNPAYTYCTDIMGYDYQVVTNPDGSQDGVCMMPDGEQCSHWDFYAGKCGQDYSWCAQNGANLEIRQDGQDAFSREYAVCIDDFGRELGTIWELAIQSTVKEASSNRVTNPLEQLPVLDSVPEVSVQADSASDMEGVSAVPTSFDWRNYIGYNWVTPVKNQLDCGSCWAFSSVGLAEAQHNIMADDPELDLDLSEQYLVSTCFSYGDCNGGVDIYALEYIRDYGIPDEACYPYISDNSYCSERCTDYLTRLKFLPNVYYLSNYDGTSYSALTMKTKISSYGPITIGMGADPDTYGNYWDGDILRCDHDIPSDGTSGVDHGVLAVGYDDAGGYWIVKNSWGSTWDGDGYFKLGYNECNVMHDLIGWTVSDLPVYGTQYRTFLPAIMLGDEPVVPTDDPIENGDFEDGDVAWVEYSSHGWDLIMNEGEMEEPFSAHSGDWFAWLGGDNNETSIISQSITIPEGLSQLRFYALTESEDSCGYDFFRVKLGTFYTKKWEICSNSDGWLETNLDFSAYAGISTTLIFELTTDSALISSVFLDDITFLSIGSLVQDALLGEPGQDGVTHLRK